MNLYYSSTVYIVIFKRRLLIFLSFYHLVKHKFSQVLKRLTGSVT